MNSILGSLAGDPESMQQLKELADLLQSQTSDATQSSDTSDSSEGFDFSSLAGLFGGSDDNGAKGIDFSMIAKLGQIISSANGDDKNRALLLALRPYVNAEKQQRIDRAVKFLKLYAIFNVLKENNMLSSLDNLL